MEGGTLRWTNIQTPRSSILRNPDISTGLMDHWVQTHPYQINLQNIRQNLFTVKSLKEFFLEFRPKKREEVTQLHLQREISRRRNIICMQ